MTYFALLSALACGHPRPAQVPGSTARAVESVTILTKDGKEPDLHLKVLLDKLGHRRGNVVVPPRYYNPLRLGEDRRRIATWGSNYGYFDIEVSKPTVREKGEKVAIDWRVEMGVKYTIGTLHVIGLPDDARDDVMALIPFRDGGAVAVNESRLLRHKLADAVRYRGYSHARVYSRAWVDREKKQVEWFYFVDPGPKTKIGSIEVTGNRRVSADSILERSGLVVGMPYSPRERDRAQLALMDAGSLVSVVVEGDEDVHRGPPEVPDSGGKPTTDASGELVPRDLATELNVRINVVEAPRREFRVEVGAEADPARSDAFAGARLILRDVFTDALHFVADGRAGYGYQLGTTGEPLGAYGYAQAQIVKAGALGSQLDLRGSARLDQRLYPDTSIREISVGPGLRRTLMDGLVGDLEFLGFRAEEVDPLALDAGQRSSVGLASGSESSGVKARGLLVHDARDSGIEAMDGHFLSALTEYSPGTVGSGHRWLRLSADARIFVPMGEFRTLAARVSGSWVGAAGDDGLPLQTRIFGGGSYGFRGFGRQRFTTRVDDLHVGGTSIVESSLEWRYLPFQKLEGWIAFLDVGAVSSENNPFASGVSSAIGMGGRARLFYIPISLDLSYRFVGESEFESPLAWDPWSLFVRMGEAF